MNRLDQRRVVDLVDVVLVLEHAVQAARTGGPPDRRPPASSGRRTSRCRCRRPRRPTTPPSTSPRIGSGLLDRLSLATACVCATKLGSRKCSKRPDNACVSGRHRPDREHDQRDRHRGRRIVEMGAGCRVLRCLVPCRVLGCRVLGAGCAAACAAEAEGEARGTRGTRRGTCRSPSGARSADRSSRGACGRRRTSGTEFRPC